MDIAAAIDQVRRLAPNAAIAREAARLRRDDVDGSLVIAGSTLTRPELDALLDRGIASGNHVLDQYIAARDVAAAASWVAEQRPIAVADPRPLITVEEVRRLHALATAGRPAVRPGVWRLAVEAPAGGVVAPPPWILAKETTAMVDRFRRRPATDEVPAWLAAFLTRFARIRPFAAANGCAARLCAALLLRRLDIVPLAIARERSIAYRGAIALAKTGNAMPLQRIVGDALLNGARRLIASSGTEALTPLRELAGPDYEALIKASKRGRLATIARNGRIFSTPAWIEDYRSGRHGARH